MLVSETAPKETHSLAIERGDILWAEDPNRAAKEYELAASQSLPARISARIGAIRLASPQLEDQQIGERSFSAARADAEYNFRGSRKAPALELMTEISALEEWAKRTRQGEDLPLPADFVEQKLLLPEAKPSPHPMLKYGRVVLDHTKVVLQKVKMPEGSRTGQRRVGRFVSNLGVTSHH